MIGTASLLFVAVASADEAKPVTDSATGTAPPATDSVSAETANAAVRSYVGLEIYPQELTLSSIRDARRVLVTGITADGQKIDVSTKAIVTTLSPVCRIDADGYVVPLASGEGSIVVAAVGHQLEVPIHVTAVAAISVDFIRDVNPILSKVGCNQGTCHGSQAGKNGFKLSLRGYDSVYDYRAPRR